jgi:esterase
MQLQYITYGDGYPLIILHGLFGSSENWQTLSRRFAKCYQVFALDLRNHGHSPHSDVFNYPAMVDDVREFMQAHTLSSAYLLGHSMGGKVAMQLALADPERVTKLVVVDIAPKPYPPEHDAIFDALLALQLDEYRTRKEIDQALARKLPDESLRQFLMKNLARGEDGAFHWELDLQAIYRHYGEISRGIDTSGRFERPTLFIRGARSHYITEKDAALITGLFPFSKIVTVPGVGHWVHSEARRQFARLVLAFLGQM